VEEFPARVIRRIHCRPTVRGVAPCSGGISRVSADGDVIAPIASAGTSPARANRKVERAATVGLMHAERAVELALAGEVSAAHQDG